MADFVCVIREFTAKELVLPTETGCRYVVLAASRCQQVVPRCVERWVMIEKKYPMTKHNRLIQELHEQYHFKRVIFTNEFGVVPALMMNEVLGLGGLPYETFIAFRDKALMCQKMANNAIPVPNFRIAETLIDLYGFANDCGYPFLLKPTLGAGGYGIKIIRGIEDLHTACNELPNFLPGCGKFDFIAQTMIDVKKTYHINGIATGKDLRCCYPSVYLEDILTSFSSEGPFLHTMDRTLRQDEPMYPILVEFARKQNEAFQVPDGHTFVYHLEVMQDQQDKLWFCENACRLGGYIEKSLLWTGIDLKKSSLLGQLGVVHKSVPENVGEQPQTDKVFSQLWFGVKETTAVHLMGEIDVGGINCYPFTPLLRELPFAPKAGLITTYISHGTLQLWLIESESPSQSEADLVELASRLQKALVYEANE